MIRTGTILQTPVRLPPPQQNRAERRASLKRAGLIKRARARILPLEVAYNWKDPRANAE